MIFKNFFIIIISLFIFNPVFALDKDLGISKKFNIHMYKKDNEIICNLYSSPITQSTIYRGKNVKLHITNRQQKKHRHKLSINMGTNVNTKKPIQVMIDNNKYTFFAYKNFIFPYNKDEKKVIRDMRRARKLKTKLYDNKDKLIIDTYSLYGLIKAISIIDRACR